MSQSLVEKVCLELFQKTRAVITAVIVVTHKGSDTRIVHEEFSMASRKYSQVRFAALLREMATQIEATHKKSGPVRKEKVNGNSNRSSKKGRGRNARA